MSSGRSRWRGLSLWAALSYVCIALLLVPVLFPLLWMLGSSVKDINEIFANPPTIIPTTLHFENYARIFQFQPFLQQYINSLGIAIVVMVATVIVSTMAGFAFARLIFPGRDKLFIFCLLGLFVPSIVTLIPLFQAARTLGWLDTQLPVIVFPLFGVQTSFGTFLMRQFFLGLPRELDDAGRLDGLSPIGRLRFIGLPLAAPALAALAILAYLTSWNLYLEPLIYLVSAEHQTVPVAITQFRDFYSGPLWNVQMAATTLSVLPPVLVFLLAQRHFIEGVSLTGIKG